MKYFYHSIIINTRKDTSISSPPKLSRGKEMGGAQKWLDCQRFQVAQDSTKVVKGRLEGRDLESLIWILDCLFYYKQLERWQNFP